MFYAERSESQDREAERRAACMDAWERKHGKWAATDNKRCWEMFHDARGDDWPASYPAAA